jgi:hypothetical protein
VIQLNAVIRIRKGFTDVIVAGVFNIGERSADDPFECLPLFLKR